MTQLRLHSNLMLHLLYFSLCKLRTLSPLNDVLYLITLILLFRPDNNSWKHRSTDTLRLSLSRKISVITNFSVTHAHLRDHIYDKKFNFN